MATPADPEGQIPRCPVSGSGELTQGFIDVLADFLDEDDNRPEPQDWKGLAIRLIEGCQNKDIRKFRRSDSPTRDILKRYFSYKSSIDVAFLWDVLHNGMGREDVAEELVRAHQGGTLLWDPTRPPLYEQISIPGCQQCNNFTDSCQAQQRVTLGRDQASQRQGGHVSSPFCSPHNNDNHRCQMRSNGCHRTAGPGDGMSLRQHHCTAGHPWLQFNNNAVSQQTREEGTNFLLCCSCARNQSPLTVCAQTRALEDEQELKRLGAVQDNAPSSSSYSKYNHVPGRSETSQEHDDQACTLDGQGGTLGRSGRFVKMSQEEDAASCFSSSQCQHFAGRSKKTQEHDDRASSPNEERHMLKRNGRFQMPREDDDAAACQSSSRFYYSAGRSKLPQEVDDLTSILYSETTVSRKQESSWGSHGVILRRPKQQDGSDGLVQHNGEGVRRREDRIDSSDHHLPEEQVTKRQDVERDILQRSCPPGGDKAAMSRNSLVSSGYPLSQLDGDPDLGTGSCTGSRRGHEKVFLLGSDAGYTAVSSSGRGSDVGSLEDPSNNLRAILDQLSPRTDAGSSVATVVTSSQRAAPVVTPPGITHRHRVGITFHPLDSALASRLKENLKEKGCRVTLLKGAKVLRLRLMDAVVVVYSRHYREELAARTRVLGSALRLVFNSLNLEYHDNMRRNKRVVFYPSFTIAPGHSIHALFHHLPEQRAAREVFDLLFAPREEDGG